MPQRLERLPYKEWWLWLLSFLAVLAILAATMVFFRQREQAAQQSRDRLNFGIATCEGGNTSRDNIKDVAEASAQLDKDIINLFTETRPEVRAQINQRLAPAFDRYQALINKIQPIDCKALAKVTTK